MADAQMGVHAAGGVPELEEGQNPQPQTRWKISVNTKQNNCRWNKHVATWQVHYTVLQNSNLRIVSQTGPL